MTGKQDESPGIRINAYLSKSGACSRREADRLILEGAVLVDGERAIPGMRIRDGQDVRLHGIKIRPVREEIWIAVHKPRGVVCTSDRRWGDRLLEDLIDCPQRVFSAGRLDKDSEGLILMTNQGEDVQRIMKSYTGHEKEYVVSVDKPVTNEFLARLEKGVYLKDLKRTTAPCKIRKSGQREFHIVLTQGLNRQIRRMCASCGYEVERLVRIRIMNILLGELQAGAWRYLTAEERKAIRKERIS